MQKYVLKFLWLEKTIGICLDQSNSDGVSIVLTDFYFWPQTDAWEKMKIFLEETPFISKNESILILNQITEVVNFWQEKNEIYLKNIAKLKEKYPYSEFYGS
jgi:30S ribosomal protein 3